MKFQLNNGAEIPAIGLGVFRNPSGESTRKAVTQALGNGYRHIDTARIYANEKDVGTAIRESGVDRSEVFVTTKLWNSDQGFEKTKEALNESLEKLQTEYVDLYLMHWPVEGLRLESWKAMEELLAEGKAKAIGVSNFMTRHLEELLEHSRVVPAVNQIELSPYNYLFRKDTVDFCSEKGIVVEAYSPLTKGRKLNDPALSKIAQKHQKTPAQILIRWALEHRFVVLPKSADERRIIENFTVFDFSLSAGDLDYLDSLNEDLITGWDPTNEP